MAAIPGGIGKTVSLTMLALVAGGFATTRLAYEMQRWLVYRRPPRYEDDRLATLPSAVVQLHHRTAQGRQMAFYFPPRGGGAPRALWLLWSGNTGRALSWRGPVDDFPGQHTGFLMVDYPGYGLCEGKPSPQAAAESADGAAAALARHLGRDLAPLLAAGGVMGHSLGAAAALDFAARHPGVGTVALIAPFTTLRAMAVLRHGRALGPLLRIRYDNVAAMRRVVRQRPAPRVVIFHAPDDEVIPFAMSRRLARVAHRHTATRLLSVKEGGHKEIRDMIRPELYRLWEPAAE